MSKKLTFLACFAIAALAFANPGPPCFDKDFEYRPVNSGLEVKLDGVTILGPVEVNSVGDYNQFHTFSNGFLSPGDGSFELQIHQIYNDGGGVNSLILDDIKITGIPIPEPTFLCILILILFPSFTRRGAR